MCGREMNLCRFVVLCNSIACVYIATMLRGLKRHDQVLKAYIYSCMFYEFYSYVVVNYHGWHLNGINGPLMCLSLYLCKPLSSI